MADCDLSLELDQEGPYAAGEKVRGHLVVEAHKTFRFDVARVTLSYRTSGRGGVDTGGDITSFEGPQDVAEGDALRIPFELGVPDGPFTMRGELIQLAWTVRGELDVPWAFDPKVEREVVVVPAAREAVAGGGYRDAPARRVDAGDRARPAAPAITRVGAAAIVALGIVGVMMFGRSGGSGIGRFQLIQLALMTCATLYVAWRLAGRDLLNQLAAKGLGAPVIEIGPSSVLRGEPLDVEVTLAPPAEVNLVRVEAELRCVERASTGSGKNRSTKTHTAHTETTVIASSVTVPKGETRTFSGKLRVPTGAHLSLDLSDNKVVWEVVVRVEPQGGVDHVTETAISVVG